MPCSPFVALLSLACVALHAVAQDVPALTSRHFDWNNLPYQVDPVATGRGPQSGYNLCNSTTEGINSMCQTAVINAVDDFCLWGAPAPNSIVANTEAASVAYCTKPGRGTRLIVAGALKGVQFIRTPAYVQVTGLIDNSAVELQPDDAGGEMDPHGDDSRGNPLGGLVFSNAFPASGGNNNTYIQAVEWHNFMGSNMFCFKACDPAGAQAADYCQHIYDTAGCGYNAPAAYAPDVFESCQGDNQVIPGTIPVGGVIPLPATSNCVTFQSSALFAALPTGSASKSSSAVSTSSHASSSTSTAKPSTSGTSGGVVAKHGNYAGLLTVVLGGAVLGAVAVFF